MASVFFHWAIPLAPLQSLLGESEVGKAQGPGPRSEGYG